MLTVIAMTLTLNNFGNIIMIVNAWVARFPFSYCRHLDKDVEQNQSKMYLT